MKHPFATISRPLGWLITLLIGLSRPIASPAHPMPNSVVLLNVQTHRIDAEIQIPLVELQAAWGHAVNDSSAGLVARLGPQLRHYLVQHIRPQSRDGRDWAVSVGALGVHETQNAINGTYRELTVQLQLIPPAGADVRRFVFRYDAVLHQVVTHKILVSVRQDWARGLVDADAPTQVGVIELDIVNNRILPLVVNLETGRGTSASPWTGFGAMVQLGIRHIGEGTDHLLFLLVLLLPAPLLLTGKPVPLRPVRRSGTGRFGWGGFGGVRYSLRRLLWIVTAFTIGHSITLLLGGLGWVRLPGQPVEILIAVSILVSAVHALRPLFPGREAWVAAGFGLVHGLAFAGTLANLHLDMGPMALCILGFNLGIELMQLFVIALTIPWLILLSRTPIYGHVRVGGALLAAVAATAWMLERLTQQPNAITHLLETERTRAVWLLAALALFALWSSWRFRSAARSSVPIS